MIDYHQQQQGRLMSADELASYLGISRNAAYTLLHREDFPSLRIGNLIYALRDEVDTWIVRRAEEGGYHYDEQEKGAR